MLNVWIILFVYIVTGLLIVIVLMNCRSPYSFPSILTISVEHFKSFIERAKHELVDYDNKRAYTIIKSIFTDITVVPVFDIGGDYNVHITQDEHTLRLTRENTWPFNYILATTHFNCRHAKQIRTAMVGGVVEFDFDSLTSRRAFQPVFSLKWR
jgi:hypothetical protein